MKVWLKMDTENPAMIKKNLLIQLGGNNNCVCQILRHFFVEKVINYILPTDPLVFYSVDSYYAVFWHDSIVYNFHIMQIILTIFLPITWLTKRKFRLTQFTSSHDLRRDDCNNTTWVQYDSIHGKKNMSLLVSITYI